MLVKELIALLQNHDLEMEVVGSDEVVFELSKVAVHQIYSGEKMPTETPGVFTMATRPCVVIS